jgi:hypothetical protein
MVAGGVPMMMMSNPMRVIVIVATVLLAQGYPYPGPPMWQQMAPPGAYGPPPGALQPGGPYGPGSPYNAPGMDNPDAVPPQWMQQAPPVPRQPPSMGPGQPFGDDDDE